MNGDSRRYSAFLLFRLLDSDGVFLSQTHRLLSEPRHAVGLSDPRIRSEIKETAAKDVFEIKIQADRVAMFVYLVGRL